MQSHQEKIHTISVPNIIRKDILWSVAWSLANGQFWKRAVLAVYYSATSISDGIFVNATINWRASSNPDFIQNYFLLKRMFDFFDNHDKYRKPGFLRGNMYTSCISMVLLDHFANKSNTFLSLPLSLSHFLLGSPPPPIPDSRIAQLKVPWRVHTQ